MKIENLVWSGFQEMVPETHTLKLQVLYTGMPQSCRYSLEYQSEIKYEVIKFC